MRRPRTGGPPHNVASRLSWYLLAWMKLAGALLVLCTLHVRAAELIVTVKSGAGPIPGSRVTLYRGGNAKGTAAEALASGTSDAAGTLRITYAEPAPSSLLYIFADGTPSPSVRLAAILGAAAVAPRSVVINEI